MARPSDFPYFATDDVIDPVSGQSNVVKPSSSVIASGWWRGAIPPRQWFNWLHRNTGQWIKQLADESDAASSAISALQSSSSSAAVDIAALANAKMSGHYRVAGGTMVGAALTLNLYNTHFVDSICAMSNTDVAVISAQGTTLGLYRFNGSTWSLLGTELYLSNPSYTPTSICALSSTDVAVRVSEYRLSRYHFDGSVWSLVGNHLSVVVDFLQSKITAFQGGIAMFGKRAGNNVLGHYTHNGTDWVLNGSLFDTGILYVDEQFTLASTHTSELIIAMPNYARAYTKGSSFLRLDYANEPLDSGPMYMTALTRDLVAVSTDSGIVIFYEWNGGVVRRLAGYLRYPNGVSGSYHQIAALSPTRLAVLDHTNDQLMAVDITFQPVTTSPGNTF